jgi:outer membrane lipoprotein-sorting protein
MIREMTALRVPPARLCPLANTALLFLISLSGMAETPFVPAQLPTAEQIVERMRVADAARSAQLEGYTAMRVYQLDNHRFRKQAKIMARVTYRRPGEKSFQVISEEGMRVICDRVLRRAIATEADASHEGNRDLARINLVNYDLKVLGTETADRQTLYVLALEPKSKSPYLVRGRAWIDANEYALVRLEGVLAKKPSIWVGSPVVRQTYIKSGLFWLPEKNLSTTDAPVFGKTDLAIESSGYEIQSASQPEAATVRTDQRAAN